MTKSVTERIEIGYHLKITSEMADDFIVQDAGMEITGTITESVWWTVKEILDDVLNPPL